MTDIFSLKDDWRDGRRKKSKFEIRSFNFYYHQFKRLFTSVYEWELPEELDSSILENYLFEDGLALIWKNDELGWIITRASISKRDINNRPKAFRPVFDNNVELKVKVPPEVYLKDDEAIAVFDTSHPDIRRSEAMFLIEEIVDIGETIRMQTFNQKTPLLVMSGTQKMRQKGMIDIIDIQNNAKALFVNSDISESIKPLNFNAPFNVETLNALRNVRINEILQYGGIDAQDAFMKKERSLVDEVEGNDEILNYMLADGLKSRQKAAEQISKLIGPCSVTIQDIVRPLMSADGSVSGLEEMTIPENKQEENENDDKSA